MNLYKLFTHLLPRSPLEAGQVIAIHPDGVTIQIPTGEQLRIRGEAEVGDHVYFRAGTIEGPAPALTGIDQFV